VTDPTTPEGYPAQCDTTAEDLTRIRERVLDDEDRLGKWTEDGWPPRDKNGIVYPIFFDADEVTESGWLKDDRGNDYDPFAGNLTPRPDSDTHTFCNTPLDGWKGRYPEIRYCGRFTSSTLGDTQHTYCNKHQKRNAGNRQTAEEHLQT